MLISNVSSAFQMHYCGGEFKSIGLSITEQGGCCDEVNSPLIDGLSFNKTKCCQNITLHSVEYDYISDFESLKPSMADFELVQPITFLSELINSDKQAFISDLINGPPLLRGNVPVYIQVQSYLI